MNKDSIMNMTIVILAIILAMILVFNYTNLSYKYVSENSNPENPQNLGNGTLENDISKHMVNIKTNKSNILSEPINMSFEPINISLATIEDARLIYLIKESDDLLRNDLTLASKAARDSDRRSIGIYGRSMQQDSKRYLYILNNISVSPSFKTLSEEYRYALEDYYNAGKRIESGSISVGNLETSMSYLEKWAERMNSIYDLLGLNRSQNPFMSEEEKFQGSITRTRDLTYR